MVIDGPCSALRGEVGPAAWVVLEDLLTGATVDGETRWAVSRTTVLVDAVPSDLPSAPVARSVKAAVSSPGGRAGSERGGAAVDVWRLIDSVGLEIPAVAQFEWVATDC
jgi:hypothetical protein